MGTNVTVGTCATMIYIDCGGVIQAKEVFLRKMMHTTK
jgi:hypothetical protein